MKSQTRTLKNKADVTHCIAYLGNITEFPVTVEIKPGKEKRSAAQNRLLYQWYSDAESQGDQTAIEYRAYCKLHFGCQVLYQEDEYFRESFDRVIRPLEYEKKLACMLPPLEMSVTSIMTVKQKSRYLDMVWQYFTGLGFILTDPSLLGIEDWRMS